LLNKQATFISFSNLDFKNNNLWLGNIFKDKIKYTSNTFNFNINKSNDALKILNDFFEKKYNS